VVASPIGNLEDMTLRALSVLKAVNLVAAEDTRKTGRLLRHFGITAALVSYHEHNETVRTPDLVRRLQQGASIAVLTNAGTPGISDPGYRIVAAAAAAGLRIVPVPGAVAAAAALSVSGLPTDAFVFEGFLA
jgi:16S rRNA (cytidine1402-2'-O)-methyltransferase